MNRNFRQLHSRVYRVESRKCCPVPYNQDSDFLRGNKVLSKSEIKYKKALFTYFVTILDRVDETIAFFVEQWAKEE